MRRSNFPRDVLKPSGTIILLQSNYRARVHSRGRPPVRLCTNCHRHPSHLAAPVLAAAAVVGAEAETSPARAEHVTSGGGGEAPLCRVSHYEGKNDLTPIDVVVKNAETNVACIKARFSLAIKVETGPLDLVAPLSNATRSAEDAGQETTTTPTMTTTAAPKGEPSERIVLGYLPLEHVLAVEDTCPAPPGELTTTARPPNSAAAAGQKGESSTESAAERKVDELEMIVTFECGKLSFKFQRDEQHIYLSSIRGVVKLDKKVVREFHANGRMFVTSDHTHHFKFDELIEVESAFESSAYILTANFYLSEIEAFRETTSRDFVWPPDPKSAPFPEAPVAAAAAAAA